MVIQHERQHLNSTSVLDEHKILTTSIDDRRSSLRRGRGSSQGGGGRGTSNKYCTYYGRSGHAVDICYGKHEYPPGHPRYPGHPRFHDQGLGAIAVNSSVINAGHESGHHELKDKKHRPGYSLTSGQYNSRMALLQPAASLSPVDISKPNSVIVSQAGPISPIPDSPSLGNVLVCCSALKSFHTPRNTTHSPFYSPSSDSGRWIIDSGATDHISS